jgi:integrase
MPPAPASAPEREPGLRAAYADHLRATGRGNRFYAWAAARFFSAWPEPALWAAEPLAVRLGADRHTRPLLSFLMLHGHLRPGYDYLVRRKFPSLWRELPHSPLRGELERFLAAARELGFSERVRSGVGSQVVARLLIQSGRPLEGLTERDLAALEAALREREAQTGQGWRHHRGALHAARAVLYHLGVLEQPPQHPLARLRQSFERRLADVPAPLRPSFVAYLERLTGTHARGTVTGTATRLAHFGRHLAAVDPGLGSLAGLDRRRHIEPYLTAVAEAIRPTDGAPISASERRARIIAVNCLLTDIAEWGWPEAPAGRLIFARDIPRLPRPLPRYLPPDADRRLREALERSPNRLAADALLLQRAAGRRIGELCDLELDCVHELPGQGAWLKVPLGKLDTERMVPLDEEALAIVDRLVEVRCPGRPLQHPRHGRPVEFLLTHHGRRLSVYALRGELRRAAAEQGLGQVTPHQLRHTYATALVNAGVSLQALMALLGHQSAAMSLRYGRLFDQTVRADYERALTLAKERLGPVLPEAPTDAPEGNWRELPLIKSRLAGGYCLRTAAQGACPYTNICEHCPNFRSERSFLPILAAQRADAEALAADAQRRGWGEEATRHRALIERLDALIGQAQAA